MTTPQVTPNMSIVLPEVGIDTDYPTTLITAFTSIDEHNHSPDFGLGLSEKSINWTSWDLGDNPLVSAGSLSFTPTSLTIPNLSLYYFTDALGTDLYFKDGAANVIRITQGGAVDAVSTVPGFTGDFRQYSASVPYSATTNTYSFFANGGPADIRVNKLTVTGTTTASTLNATMLGGITIPSAAYFPADCVLCIDGNPVATVAKQSVNIATPANSRLIQNSNQLNNQVLNNGRQKRFNVLPGPKTNIQGQTIAPEAPSTETCEILMVQGSFLQAGTSSKDYLNWQKPLVQLDGNNQTDIHFFLGSVAPVNFEAGAGAAPDTLRFNVFHRLLPASAFMVEDAHRLVNICIIAVAASALQNPRVTSFFEFSAKVGTLIYAGFQIIVKDSVTGVRGVPGTDYIAMVRV